jgi:hypothetical protein
LWRDDFSISVFCASSKLTHFHQHIEIEGVEKKVRLVFYFHEMDVEGRVLSAACDFKAFNHILY